MKMGTNVVWGDEEEDGRLAFLATCTVDEADIDDTIDTLRFASRCRYASRCECWNGYIFAIQATHGRRCIT